MLRMLRAAWCRFVATQDERHALIELGAEMSRTGKKPTTDRERQAAEAYERWESEDL